MIGSAWVTGTITATAVLVGAATMPPAASGHSAPDTYHVESPLGQKVALAPFAFPQVSEASLAREFEAPMPVVALAGSFEIIHHHGIYIPPSESCGYVPTIFGAGGDEYVWKKNGKYWSTGELVTFTSPTTGSVYLEVYEYVNGVQTNYADLTLYVDSSVPDYYCDPT